MMRDAVKNPDDTYNWVFVKYDVLSRPVESGIYKVEDDRSILQTAMENQTALYESRTNNSGNPYYTNSIFPITSVQLLSVNFYDDYSFDHSGLDFNPVLYTDYSVATRGLPTGKKVNILGTSDWLTSTVYYDDKNRAIQLQNEHQLQGKDQYDIQYDFEGKAIHTERHHSKAGADDINILNNFIYDRMNRLQQVTQKVNNDDGIILAQYEYNELGQITRKNLHQFIVEPGDPIQGVDYRYNLRGWLKSINNASLTSDENNPDMNDVFGEELFYNGNNINSPVYTIKNFYNGNIAATKWKTKAPQSDGSLISENMYVYRYDDLNRLTAGYYLKNSLADPTTFDAKPGRYNEWENYDMEGNLLSLNRNGQKGAVDRLTYTYYPNSNRLQSVEDAGISEVQNFYENAHLTDEYVYDDNGNITNDYNKNLEYIYNFLSLPQTITKGSEIITYTYDGNGQKLSQSTGTITHDYVNGIEYENGSFLFSNTSEGRVRLKNSNATNGSQYVYDYFIKDHLGNVRSIITEENITPDNYLASMEPDRDAVEQALFDHVPETRKERPFGQPYDPIYWSDDYVSQIRNINPIGHAKAIQMNEGDAVDIDVRYYFEGIEALTNTLPISSILLNLANSFMPGYSAGTLTAEQLTAANNTFIQNGQLNAFLTSCINSTSTTTLTAPQAYLTWLFFDDEFNFVPEQSGMLQASDPDQLGDLAQLDIEAPSNGYLYVYVSNQSDQEVNFNNLRMAHRQGRLLQTSHYYPYGMLTDMSGTASNPSINKYRYQDKELETALNLNMEEFGFRQYDPSIARWIVQDPIDNSMNMYIAMGLNPVSMIDPDGAKNKATIAEPPPPVPDFSYITSAGGGGGGNGSLWKWASLSPGEQLSVQMANGTTYVQQALNTVLTLAATSSTNELQVNNAVLNDAVSYLTHSYEHSSNNSTSSIQAYQWFRMIGQDDRESAETDDLKDGVQFIINGNSYWHGPFVGDDNITENENDVDPSTLNRNYCWTNYIGPRNPLTKSKKPYYGAPPLTVAEFPAIEHDQVYDFQDASGASGVLFNTNTIGNDWEFVAKEFNIGLDPTNDPMTRFQANTSAIIMGLGVSFKTICSGLTGGLANTVNWYYINKLVVKHR